jgi:hypothetical protein
MSQADQNIAASPNSDKTPSDTAMAAAMTAARETTKPRAAADAKPQGRAQVNRSGKANPQATNGQARPAARRQPVRHAITFELVASLVPAQAKADRMVATFALEPVDYPAIREHTEEHIIRISNELTDNLNEKAMAIFMQRVVGSFVSGAYGAAQFYGNKKSDALALHNKLLNDAPDEDRDPVAGFESRAERAAIFAAEMGLQAYAMMAAAEGAVSAYEHITGDVWRPYESSMPATPTTQRRSADEMRAALED